MGELRDKIGSITAGSPGRWAVRVQTVEGEAAAPVDIDVDTALRSASTAKILLLLTVAEQIDDGTLDPVSLLTRDRTPRVADSGLWQHLRQPRLPVADVAALVGAVSDNWATNVLIDTVGGIDAIADAARRFGARDVTLHDLVRDRRGPADPPTLSTGSARGYADLLTGLWARRAEPAAGMVLDWLRPGVDHSMVAGAFGLDPLAHQEADRGWVVIQKTGTDIGVRVDVGVVSTSQGALAYACLVNWDERGGDGRDEVLATMRAMGAAIRAEMSY